LISPTDIEYYELLNSRFPHNKITNSYNNNYNSTNSSVNKTNYNLDKTIPFQSETKFLIGKLMQLIISTEVILEKRRQYLNSITRFTIKGVFNKMDKHGRHYIIKEEVNRVIVNYLDVTVFKSE